jgi:hypothetical protein
VSAFYVVVRHFPGSTIVRRRHELTVEAAAVAVAEELAAGYGSVTVEAKP